MTPSARLKRLLNRPMMTSRTVEIAPMIVLTIVLMVPSRTWKMEANRLEMPLMISDIVARGGVESVSLTDGSYDGICLHG